MYRVVALLLGASLAYSQSPSSPQELLREAVTAQQAGNLDLAIRDYKELLGRHPNIPEVRSNLGAALSAKGEYSEAIVQYLLALKIKPEPQVRLNLALAYYKTGQLTAATETLQKLQGQTPENPQVIVLLADCYLRTGRNKDVVDLLTSRQRAEPNNPAYNYLLGTALVRDGQIGQGQVIIDKILRNGDSAEARLLMGTTKYMAKDYSEAIEDLRKAVELNPGLPEAHAWYGLALLMTGDQAGAKTAFEQELKDDPNNFDANLRLGVLLRQDEDNAAALRYFNHALLIRPGDPGVRYQIASLELASGHLEKAQTDLEALIKESPDFLEAHVSLATVYFREKRKSDGERERGVVAKLNAERQAKSPALSESEASNRK